MITAGLLSTTDLAAAVRASIRGDVVSADEPSFPAACFGVAGIAPELVVVATDAADVGRTVALAGRTGRRVVAQIIGQRTAVRYERTILVLTRLLATVRVDPDRATATVGIGASWRQVLDAAEPFGLTALSAATEASPTGHGPALRARASVFAFAADRIRSFEVITAGGERRPVGRRSPDFAALRLGQTAPGLVVSMTLELVRHPALTAAELTFAAADAPRVFARWQRWAAELPPTAVTGVAAGSDSRTVRVAHIGDPGQAVALLSALRTAVEVAPVSEWFGPATVAAVARGGAAARKVLAA